MISTGCEPAGKDIAKNGAVIDRPFMLFRGISHA